MKSEIDELLLTDIDTYDNQHAIFSADSLHYQNLSNHSSAIAMLSYNKVGSILASACQRGLIYVNFLEVCNGMFIIMVKLLKKVFAL